MVKPYRMQECTGQIFYIDGRFLTCEAFSNEYVFQGDALYEVVRIIQGVPVFFEDHMDRLAHSASVTGRQLWLPMDEMKTILYELVEKNQSADGNIKLVFNYQAAGSRHFLMYYLPHLYPEENQYNNGVPAILYMAERPNPTVKIIHAALRLEVYKNIIERGVYEALLVNKNGYITEGSRSNVFFIRDNLVFTAPDEAVLPGISRKYVIECLREQNTECRTEMIHMDDLKETEAVFITGTSPKVLPVCEINKIKFRVDNKILRELMRQYDHMVAKYVMNNKK